jgi:hypothetical protein
MQWELHFKKESGPKRYTSELVLNEGKQTNHIIYASELVLKRGKENKA